jgi:hypothetical protein
VSGTLFSCGENALQIDNFTYDGSAPDLYFWIGDKELSNQNPINKGLKIVTEDDKGPLEKYDNATMEIKIPDDQDIKTSNMKWFSVWCEKFTVEFGRFIIRQ